MDPADLRILHADVRTIDTWWSENRRIISPFWRLYRHDRSGAAIVCDGEEHPLLSHRVYLIPAWLRFDCVCRRELEHCYAHVDPGWPAPAVHPRWSTPLSPPPEHPLHGLAAGLPACGGEARARLVAACCQAAFAWLLAEAGLDRLTPRIPATVAPALALAERHLAEPITLARMAAACGCGGDHLGRLFRQHLGLAPLAWLRQRRCLRAAELLLTEAVPIEAVAAACGFANRYHFSRVFRQVLQISPAAYRRGGR